MVRTAHGASSALRAKVLLLQNGALCREWVVTARRCFVCYNTLLLHVTAVVYKGLLVRDQSPSRDPGATEQCQ
jgi:hypothetical protein